MSVTPAAASFGPEGRNLRTRNQCRRFAMVTPRDIRLLVATVAVIGCDSASPVIPQRDGPLELAVRYPGSTPLVLAESVATWGSVGSGRAQLRVNGHRVRVEPNGAFLGWLPVPPGPAAVLEFEATLDGRTIREELPLDRALPATPSSAPIPMHPMHGWVRLRRLPSDTADSATQWRPVASRWYPGGPLALALPLGARLPVDLRTTDAVRVRLTEGIRPWVAAIEVDTLATPRSDPVPLGPVRLAAGHEGAEVSVATPEPLASTVELEGDRLRWSIFGARHATPQVETAATADPIRAVERQDGPAGEADVVLWVAGVPGGWQVRWRAGRLTLIVREPWPAERGLAHLIVALDGGHPPAGATGPTGLHEDSVTLAVARAAARRLTELGALPVLVRLDERPLSLEARLARAEEAGAQVFVSIHVNAPGDGRRPWLADGTETFFSEPLAQRLAAALRDSVAVSMGQMRRGPTVADLAVLRASWFAAALVEGTCLVLPGREAWLRTPEGIEAYAAGIVAGLARWASEVPEPIPPPSPAVRSALRDSLPPLAPAASSATRSRYTTGPILQLQAVLAGVTPEP